MSAKKNEPITITRAAAMTEEQRRQYGAWKEKVESAHAARVQEREEALRSDPGLPELESTKEAGEALEFLARACIAEGYLELSEELTRLLDALRQQLKGRDRAAISAATEALRVYVDDHADPPDPPLAAQMALRRPDPVG